MSVALDIVFAGLKVIEAVAPSVALAITGGQSVDDAAKAAREAWAKLPKRGEAWERDLEDRKKSGG